MKNIKLTRWTTIAVLIFIAVWLLLRGMEARAETTVEVSPATAFIAGHHYEGATLMMTERFARRYDVGIILSTAQTCSCRRGDSPGNLGIHAQRMVAWKHLEMGLGVAYWANQTPAWNSNVTFALSVGLTFDRWVITHRHYSTGGSSELNGGLDMLTIGYRFP